MAGRLQIQIQRVAGTFAQDHNSDCSDGSKSDDENPVMTVQVSLKRMLHIIQTVGRGSF